MEKTLYLPVKAFLESAGYRVKGEIGGCDMVGLSDDDPGIVVICELKLTFNLELVLQAVDRASVCDEVWIAARISARGKVANPTVAIAISAGDWASACWASRMQAWSASSSSR